MLGQSGVDELAALSTFSELSVDEISAVLGSARTVEFEPGATIVAEGSIATSAFVLLVGELEVLRRVRGANFGVARVSTPGSVVGEVAFLAGGKRTATITALTHSRLIELGRSDFEDLLEMAPKLGARLAEEALARMEASELQSFLARTLGTDDPETLADIARTATWHRTAGGEVLFRAGDSADAAYVIVSGRLGLTDPASTTRLELGRGEILGELGVIGDGKRSMTAQTLRDSVLVRFPAETFDAVMDHRPHLMLEIARRMVKRAREPARRPAGAMVVAVVVIGALDRLGIVKALSAQLSALGQTEHLGSARAEALLGHPGAAEAGFGDPAEPRVVSLLHELELSCSWLFLDLNGAGPVWTRRCLRQADRVVVVTATGPSTAEVATIRDLFASANPSAERLLVVSHQDPAKLPIGSAHLVNQTGAGRIINVQSGSVADLARVARVITGQAYGLVLSGGGARGFAHIGVYRAMSELGVPIDWVGGSSIGSVFAAMIALGLDPETVAKLAVRLFRGVLDYTLPLVSLVKGSRISSNISAVVGDADIEDLWRGFFCVSTNLTQATSQVHDRGSLARSIRASVAIPGVIPPVPWEGDLLVDGSVMDNLPVGTMRSLQPSGTIIAIDLAPSLGPRAKSDFGLSISGWKALASKARGTRRAYPSIAAVLMRSMITASESQRTSKRAESDLYIDLDLRGVGILDFETIGPVILAGYEQSMPRLEEWMRGRGQGEF